MSRVLYTGTKNASSWACRAWLAMRELDIRFEERVIDIRRPQRYANLGRIAEISPAGAVPVLVDGDVVIFDSLAIMEYANDIGDGSLLPRDARFRAHTRSLVAWVHSGMSNLCSDISFESSFDGDRRPMTAAEQLEAGRVFALWELELERSGGPFLSGPLSLADLAFVPVVRRLCYPDSFYAHWPRVITWIRGLMSRQSVEEWMGEAESLPLVVE